MLRLSVSLATICLLTLARPAQAQPVWLNCSASGQAGSVAFRFAFDEQAQSAAAIWNGGGRPGAEHYGATGSDNGISVVVSITAIGATFSHNPYDDPYVYRVNIDRTTGTLEFLRYNGGLRVSSGTCARGEPPPGGVF